MILLRKQGQRIVAAALVCGALLAVVVVMLLAKLLRAQRIAGPMLVRAKHRALHWLRLP